MGSDDDDTDEASGRTVIVPAAKPPARTVIAPAGQSAPEKEADGLGPEIPTAQMVRSDRVEVGDELNGIFRVVRRIGAGGMGEVFEGLEIESGQHRVAIKVMLPSLAADPEVQASFQREGRVLQRLSHPALVKYIFSAREPRLGVLYMVTEFIDGGSLEDLVGTDLSADQLIALTRRLAEGLKAAHEAGIDAHRDMSPDNVLLPGGRMEEAKIVDFGIAKTADPKKGTIVGHGGFAGKLGFAAPEQFGAHGGIIGPWTDVYSLGLVILTLALGKSFHMGATLVEAVQRREAVPDLSGAPEVLREPLRRMLAPDPSARARSMDEVLALLPRDGAGPPRSENDRHSWNPDAAATSSPGRRGRLVWMGGGAAFAVLAALFAVILTSRHPSSEPDESLANPDLAHTGATSEVSASPAGVTATIEAAIREQPCTWVNVARVETSGGPPNVTLQGVSQNPITVQQAATRAARGASVDTRLVWAIPAAEFCEPIQAFRGLDGGAAADGARISSAQSDYTVSKDGQYGVAAIQVALHPGDNDFALVFLDADSAAYVTPGKLNELAEKDPTHFTHGDTAHYGLQSESSEGIHGVMLLVSPRKKLPDLSRFISTSGQGSRWGEMAEEARKAGATAEIVWYRVSRS